jgi:hypothetical protein
MKITQVIEVRLDLDDDDDGGTGTILLAMLPMQKQELIAEVTLGLLPNKEVKLLTSGCHLTSHHAVVHSPVMVDKIATALHRSTCSHPLHLRWLFIVSSVALLSSSCYTHPRPPYPSLTNCCKNNSQQQQFEDPPPSQMPPDHT